MATKDKTNGKAARSTESVPLVSESIRVQGEALAAKVKSLMHEANVTHGRSNKYLPRQAQDFADDLGALSQEIARLALTPLEQAPEYLRAVLTARLRVSELTLEAGQSALMHFGARGYIEGSPVNRRIREGHFVAIITPSIRHLRQELSKPELRTVTVAAGGTVH